MQLTPCKKWRETGISAGPLKFLLCESDREGVKKRNPRQYASLLKPIFHYVMKWHLLEIINDDAA